MSIRGWKEQDWGDTFPVDVPLSKAKPENFDALLLPGGVMNPDKLRMEKKAVAFVRHFFDEGKPVGAICHGPQILIDAKKVVRDRALTSWPSLETDLRNAEAEWVDKQVVVDSGLVTSRKPADIPTFSKKLIEEIGEGIHDKQKPSRFAGRKMQASGVDGENGAPGRTRTFNQLIKSQLLCQLSYRGDRQAPKILFGRRLSSLRAQ